MGKATYDVRSAIRLAKVVSLLATNYSGACSRDQLDTRTRITYNIRAFVICFYMRLNDDLINMLDRNNQKFEL